MVTKIFRKTSLLALTLTIILGCTSCGDSSNINVDNLGNTKINNNSFHSEVYSINRKIKPYENWEQYFTFEASHESLFQDDYIMYTELGEEIPYYTVEQNNGDKLKSFLVSGIVVDNIIDSNQKAYDTLWMIHNLMEIENPYTEFKLHTGETKYEFTQFYNGYRVEESSLSIKLSEEHNEENELIRHSSCVIEGNIVPTEILNSLDCDPSLSIVEANKAAEDVITDKIKNTELVWTLKPNAIEETIVLAYRMVSKGNNIIYVDANSGEVLGY